MKKILYFIACLAGCLLAVLACDKEPKPETPAVVTVAIKR